jgi:hypothetical protein
MRKLILLILLTACIVGFSGHVHADDNLVASLETLNDGVSVQRAGTLGFVAVKKETLVGVGDSIKTDSNGQARITFFANGTDTTVLPGTEFRIDSFSGSEDQYQLAVTVVVGQTESRVQKLLDSGSSYQINSSGMEMAVRGTVFAVRVEQSGRSATIVEQGLVKTKSSGSASMNADIPAGYGVRTDKNKGLSDVVKAANFKQLDSALDGCGALIQTIGDVVLNVRLGPGLNFQRIGELETRRLEKVIGETETTQWYRIPYRGGFAWVFAPALKLDSGCPGLRQFSDSYGPEDGTQYSNLDKGIVVTPLPTMTPTPLPTLEATGAATP